METFGLCVGLAFQIDDDLLDVLGDAKDLGKQTGMDAQRGKMTWPSLVGVEAAQKKIPRAVDAGGRGAFGFRRFGVVPARVCRGAGQKRPKKRGSNRGGYLLEIINNRVIQAAALAWAIAQGIKVLLTLAISRRFDYTRVFGSGGMPSWHSSMACAMLMVVGLRGLSSAVFALAFCFAGVTMYDAAGVRRSTGRNAAVINHIVEGLYGQGLQF